MIKVIISGTDSSICRRLSEHIISYVRHVWGIEAEVEVIESIYLNTTNRRFSHMSHEETCDLDNISRVECRKNMCKIYYDDYYEMYNPRTVYEVVQKVKEDDSFIKLNRAEYVHKDEIIGFRQNDIAVTRDMSYIKMSPTGKYNVSMLFKK